MIKYCFELKTQLYTYSDPRSPSFVRGVIRGIRWRYNVETISVLANDPFMKHITNDLQYDGSNKSSRKRALYILTV